MREREMLGKRPYLPSFDQDRPSPNPVSSSSACRRVIIGFEIGAKEDTNQPLSLGMHRQTSLAAMSSLFSHKKGNPSFRPDKPETVLVVDPPPTTTSSTLPGTLVIPNPKQHPLSLAQPEVEKKKTMAKSAPWRQSPAQTAVARSVFDAHVETKGLPPSFLSSSSSFSSCFEEISCEHPARLDFLQSCFFCRLSLSMARDIYMYRGDRAFCSVDCRYQQIVIDERNDRCSLTSPMTGARSRTNTTTYAS